MTAKQSRLMRVTLFALLLTGCVGNAPQFSYYTLQATATTVGAINPLPESLGIAPVETPGWLDQTPLIWSDGGVHLTKKETDRWAEPLPDAIARTMMQNFSRYYAGGQVSLGPWVRDERPDRVVKLEILSLARRDNRLIMDVKWILSDKDKGVMVSRFHTYSQALNDASSTAEYVQAFSELLNMVTKNIALSL